MFIRLEVIWKYLENEHPILSYTHLVIDSSSHVDLSGSRWRIFEYSDNQLRF